MFSHVKNCYCDNTEIKGAANLCNKDMPINIILSWFLNLNPKRHVRVLQSWQGSMLKENFQPQNLSARAGIPTLPWTRWGSGQHFHLCYCLPFCRGTFPGKNSSNPTQTKTKIPQRNNKKTPPNPKTPPPPPTKPYTFSGFYKSSVLPAPDFCDLLSTLWTSSNSTIQERGT